MFSTNLANDHYLCNKVLTKLESLENNGGDKNEEKNHIRKNKKKNFNRMLRTGTDFN